MQFVKQVFSFESVWQFDKLSIDRNQIHLRLCKYCACGGQIDLTCSNNNYNCDGTSASFRKSSGKVASDVRHLNWSFHRTAVFALVVVVSENA